MASRSEASISDCANEKKSGNEKIDLESTSAHDPKIINISSRGSETELEKLYEVFSRFEVYDFNSDQKFQSGLQKISKLPSGVYEQPKDLLKIKGFYYSRNVEPINLPEYMKWKVSQTQRKPHHISDTVTVSDFTANRSQPSDQGKYLIQVNSSSKYAHAAPADLNAESQTLTRFGDADSKSASRSENEPSSASGNVDLYVRDSETANLSEDSDRSTTNTWNSQGGELTFAEVAYLIQSGQPIPGLAQIEVKPTNKEPTPSQFSRAKKPWET